MSVSTLNFPYTTLSGFITSIIRNLVAWTVKLEQICLTTIQQSRKRTSTSRFCYIEHAIYTHHRTIHISKYKNFEFLCVNTKADGVVSSTSFNDTFQISRVNIGAILVPMIFQLMWVEPFNLKLMSRTIRLTRLSHIPVEIKFIHCCDVSVTETVKR